MATQTMTVPKLDVSKAPPSERIRTYKEFLTPALHRHFTTAAGVLLLFCWLDSFLFSTSQHIFWSWFPLGPAGVRALMLFISCLAIFMVRISGLHVGERTNSSMAETVVTQVGSFRSSSNTFFMLGGYIFSAWWFGEVYLWSRDETATLGMLVPAQTYERPRLNENPVFLRCLYPTVALIQATFHFARDYDRVAIPVRDAGDAIRENQLASLFGQKASIFTRLPLPFRILTERFITLGRHILETTFLGILVAFIAYMSLLRRFVWTCSYALAQSVIRELPPSAAPSGFFGWRLPFQTAYSVVLLIGLWEASNAVFDAIVTQKPLKKGQPLTSEVKDGRGVILSKSKDPNGSLLSGLESKRDVNKSFAFWELYLICTEFDARRKTIYAEVDRKGGSTWSRVCTSALQQVQDIKSRIETARASGGNIQQQQKSTTQDKAEPLGLKHIADQGVKSDGDVFVRRKPDFGRYVGDMAKSIGQSPGADDPVTARARKALRFGTDLMLSQEDQQRLSPQHLHQQAGGYLTQLLKSPIGAPFRQTFACRVRTVVFGAPHSNRVNIVHAVKSLAKLAVFSLQEDDFGQVQKDIAKIVRSLTEAITTIQKFTRELQPSWTDVNFSERDRRIQEVEELLDVFQDGLQDIILRFGEYANALGLSKKEVREAREAAAKHQGSIQPQMQQVGSRNR